MKWDSYSDINIHIRMLSDEVRTNAFRSAIEKVVRPGMSVLDFGCGLGILSFFAERAGAARVYAVDSSPIIKAARAVAKANGFERIQFIQTNGGDFDLPEKVDVIVSECLGHYVFQERMVSALFRVRDRHLREGGTIIPKSVKLWASVAEKPLDESISYFDEPRYGVDFGPLRPFAHGQRRTLVAPQLEVAPACMADLDFATASAEPRATVGVVQIPKPITAFGIVAWFDATLVEGIELRTGPDHPTTHWRQSYFPFAEKPSLEPGLAEIGVAPVPIHTSTLWRWWIRSQTVLAEGDSLVWLHLATHG